MLLRFNQAVTLMEIVITLIITGILAAVALPSLNNMISQSKRQNGRSSLLLIHAAMKKRIIMGDHPTCGGALGDIAAINNCLGLSISVDAGQSFDCDAGTQTTFSCRWNWDERGEGLKMNNAPISSSNPTDI